MYAGRPNYLGFMVAAAAPVAAATGPLAPLTFAGMAIASVLPFVGSIGAGRKEADAIGPHQQELGRDLDQLDKILSTETLTVDDLRGLHAQLTGLWQSYLQFIYQDAFTRDGDTRASDGSRSTMEPQVNARLQTITQLINALLGKVTPPQAMQSSYPSLQFRPSTNLTLPQAGFLQAGAVTLTPKQPGAIAAAPPTFDSGVLMKFAVAGALAWAISRR